jgi:malate synthase
MNCAPAAFDASTDLPDGFLDFFMPLHREFTPRQRILLAERFSELARAYSGRLPNYLEPSEATDSDWRVELPDWCQDQRNQMTGPADDAELVVKMLNSGAPGVMLDLEDSMANEWPNFVQGIDNILEAIAGRLTYFDVKRDREVEIAASDTVIFTRPRGLHLSQVGVLPGERVSASLFDVAMVAYRADPETLKHPLAFYIPKTQHADEAHWWRDLFRAIARDRGLPDDYIKCMALVESHAMAYEFEEFAFHLRDHMLGLNLGRWDYMASLIHFNLLDPAWVLPDRNTIPHDVPFFQNLRELMPEICHKRGIMAIGGMTALYPSRVDPELNERALNVLEEDKKNEADSLMDGAWTGHPDQNQIAVDQFPYPNQLDARPQDAERYPDLRPVPEAVGERTVAGTRAAIRTVIRYRYGVLTGKGASLLDGYMEDLATDRIYRLMIAQRMIHRDEVEVMENGEAVPHDPATVSGLFDEELERIVDEFSEGSEETANTYRRARELSEQMIVRAEFDPV